jgi:cytoskeletal protein CcmA (bactofilin family)
MWNKKKEDEPQRPAYTPPAAPPPAPPAPAPKPPEARKETAPVSTMPPARFEPETRGGSATIGKAVKIAGNIYSREDLYVDGDLEGTVEALEHKLTIGPNGTVKATIKAREVVVLGAIHGNVEAADKIEIRKDAKLTGDIRTARIIIEDGAYFKGSIDIVKPEPKLAAKPAYQAAAPVSTTAAAASMPTAAGVENKR